MASSTGPEIVFQIGEAAPVVTVDDRELFEGDYLGLMLITFRLSEPADSAVTVEWTTADGSAIAGEDYLAAGGTVTFRRGGTTALRILLVLGDTTFEPDESFEVVLLEADGAVVGDPATVTLLNDDDEAPELPELSIGDVEMTEGDRRWKLVAVPDHAVVACDMTGSASRSRRFAGTASAGDDFVDQARTPSSAQGSRRRTSYVVVVGDTVPEGDEWFTVEVSNLVGATLADGIGEVVIIDDD